MVHFSKLWKNHPGRNSKPCNSATFPNQCAMRMGIAIEKSGIDTSSFDTMYPNRRCYPGFKHNPRHILAAQELANWINRNTAHFGIKKIYKNVTSADFSGKKGIVFIKDGWGSTDHIDVWDGSIMKGGSSHYFSKGKEVWFWSII